MDLKKLFEKEFAELNKKLDNNKTVTLESNSLDVSGFEAKLAEYRKSIDKVHEDFVSRNYSL